jgi:hypothetical protein
MGITIITPRLYTHIREVAGKIGTGSGASQPNIEKFYRKPLRLGYIVAPEK